MNISISKAELNDLDSVLKLIQELAIYEKEPNAVDISVSELKKDYLNNSFSCLIAKENNKVVGMALYYNRYSTWKGKTIHLEDLIVTKEQRGKGIGKALLDKIVFEAKEKGYRRVEWCVLDWNEPAIKFYESVGGAILKDWYLVQLDKERIDNYK